MILASGLPDQPPARCSAMDIVRGARGRAALEGSLAGSQGVAYVTALIWSRLHSGEALEAAELADREAMIALHGAAGRVPAANQSVCYSVLAETYLLNGRLRESTDCGRFAMEYADEADDDGCRFRAQGLLAASLALSGEINSARDAMDLAKDLASYPHWINQQAAWPMLLGIVLVHGRMDDASTVESACKILDRVATRDPTVRAIARFCRIVLCSVRQDNRQIVATARLIAQGSDSRTCPPFLIGLTISMEAIAYVHLGDPGAALSVVEGKLSPTEHSVCFELIRATVYLQLGRFREVINITDACVKHCPDHNLGTLASVYLRRALAYQGLGFDDNADAEYSRSSHLAYDCGMVCGPLGVPLAAIERMRAALALNEPEFAKQLDGCIRHDYDFPDRAPLGFALPNLTERESVLAGWLLSGLTLPGAAAEMQVSINTVKSQSKSLYQKLGVSSRQEAILRLKRTGLYVRQTPRTVG